MRRYSRTTLDMSYKVYTAKRRKALADLLWLWFSRCQCINLQFKQRWRYKFRNHYRWFQRLKLCVNCTSVFSKYSVHLNDLNFDFTPPIILVMYLIANLASFELVNELVVRNMFFLFRPRLGMVHMIVPIISILLSVFTHFVNFSLSSNSLL